MYAPQPHQPPSTACNNDIQNEGRPDLTSRAFPAAEEEAHEATPRETETLEQVTEDGRLERDPLGPGSAAVIRKDPPRAAVIRKEPPRAAVIRRENPQSAFRKSNFWPMNYEFPNFRPLDIFDLRPGLERI